MGAVYANVLLLSTVSRCPWTLMADLKSKFTILLRFNVFLVIPFGLRGLQVFLNTLQIDFCIEVFHGIYKYLCLDLREVCFWWETNNHITTATLIIKGEEVGMTELLYLDHKIGKQVHAVRTCNRLKLLGVGPLPSRAIRILIYWNIKEFAGSSHIYITSPWAQRH